MINKKQDKILWEGKPDMKVIFTKIFMTLIFIVIALFFIGYFSTYLILIPVFVIFIAYQYFLIKTYHYSITTEGIISQGGIFFKFKRNVPFNKVTDINIKQGPIDQILGLYRISIQTAGMGHRIAEVTFMGLLNTDKPESIIKEQINKIQK